MQTAGSLEQHGAVALHASLHPVVFDLHQAIDGLIEAEKGKLR